MAGDLAKSVRCIRRGHGATATCLATVASVVVLSIGVSASTRSSASRMFECDAMHSAAPMVSHELAPAPMADAELGAAPSTPTHPLVLAADTVDAGRSRAVSLSRFGSLYGP